jgi:hypothetical protein
MLIARANQSHEECQNRGAEQGEGGNHTNLEGRKPQRGQIDRQQDSDEAVAEVPQGAGAIDVEDGIGPTATLVLLVTSASARPFIGYAQYFGRCETAHSRACSIGARGGSVGRNCFTAGSLSIRSRQRRLKAASVGYGMLPSGATLKAQKSASMSSAPSRSSWPCASRPSGPTSILGSAYATFLVGRYPKFRKDIPRVPHVIDHVGAVISLDHANPLLQVALDQKSPLGATAAAARPPGGQPQWRSFHRNGADPWRRMGHAIEWVRHPLRYCPPVPSLDRSGRSNRQAFSAMPIYRQDHQPRGLARLLAPNRRLRVGCSFDVRP